MSKLENENNVLAGFILLTDANMDWPRFRHYLKEDWNIIPEDQVKDDALVFTVDEMMVACSLMPAPVPNNEAEQNAKNNILWKEGTEEVAKHKAHVMLAIMNKSDAVAQSVLFAKVCSSLLKLKNTIGVYKSPTVYEKQFYIDNDQMLKDDELPMPIMIFIGMYIAKDALMCAYTYGLRFFGKEEIEVVNSKAQPGELYKFLLSISEYSILSDDELKHGDTIGFTENQKLPITLSDGVSVDGQSIKIGYLTEK